eukprot:681809-Amphidinium_carterae.1
MATGDVLKDAGELPLASLPQFGEFQAIDEDEQHESDVPPPAADNNFRGNRSNKEIRKVQGIDPKLVILCNKMGKLISQLRL